jgi:hypothetical protein
MYTLPTAPTEVSIQLKQFLTFTEYCPPRWKAFDLYVVSDEQVAFYVGQSQCAFERLWEHIRGGPKGHALLGRFILCNWPRSASWTVSLLSSSAARFAGVDFQRDAAERLLISELRPCLNVSLNDQPNSLPACYLPPNTPVKNLRSFRRMLREAGYHRRSSPDDDQW